MASTTNIMGYVPSNVWSFVGIIAFGVLAGVFWFRWLRSGRPRFMLTLCISTTAMVIGFVIRIPLHKSQTLGSYMMFTLFTLLSPCGFIANNYIILPRLATTIDAEDSLFLPVRKVVRIFIWSDVITFWMQGSGGGLTAARSSTLLQTIGKWVVLVGLILQCISFLIFTSLLIVFGRRVRNFNPDRWPDSAADMARSFIRERELRDWRFLYWALIWSCVGIIVRCIYRVIEYSEGYTGYLRTTEWCVLVLDSLPLLLAIAVWTVIWPPALLGKGKCLPQVASNGHIPIYSPAKVHLSDGARSIALYEQGVRAETIHCA